MFSDLTNGELCALFIRIKAGRDRAYRAFAPRGDARYLVCVDASEIMVDIHDENAAR
jgi:hypothetical protein